MESRNAPRGWFRVLSQTRQRLHVMALPGICRKGSCCLNNGAGTISRMYNVFIYLTCKINKNFPICQNPVSAAHPLPVIVCSISMFLFQDAGTCET